MTVIRILVVDDDESIRGVLQLSLPAMDDRYQVSVAVDGFEALDLLRESPFDLVISDYVMPGMDGLELLESIRLLSPQTRLIVTSALQSKSLPHLLNEAGIEYFLAKPFSLSQIRQLVAKALAGLTPTIVEPVLNPAQPSLAPEVRDYLRDLVQYTGARYCLVVESAGYVIAAAGQDQQIPLDALASLAAAHAAATAEMSRLLGNTDPFQATIHEGQYYNLASYLLVNGRILVVVFDKQIKIGLVQHYARQTAAALPAVLPPPIATLDAAAFLGENFLTSLNASLDELILPNELNEMGVFQMS